MTVSKQNQDETCSSILRTHTKISRVISVKHVQQSLMMDRKRSETCRS